jgi:hypothetical protein
LILKTKTQKSKKNKSTKSGTEGKEVNPKSGRCEV